MEGDIQGATIAFVGTFAPSLVSPAWLALHEVIGPEELKSSDVKVIVPVASIFTADWLSVNVDQQRLFLQTTIPQEFDRLRDVAIGIIRSLESPMITAVGINTEVHWQTQNNDVFNAFGDRLAPKQYWDDLLNVPGMNSLVIRGVRDDAWSGWVDITVQPSVRLRPNGIYAMVNDHFILKRVDYQPQSRDDFRLPEMQNYLEPPSPSSSTAQFAIEILGQDWDSRRSYAETTVSRIVRMSNGEFPNA